eukprot:scaffold4372_cov397-Prasinococcus_capsulatus_cf.AAC.28
MALYPALGRCSCSTPCCVTDLDDASAWIMLHHCQVTTAVLVYTPNRDGSRYALLVVQLLVHGGFGVVGAGCDYDIYLKASWQSAQELDSHRESYQRGHATMRYCRRELDPAGGTGTRVNGLCYIAGRAGPAGNGRHLTCPSGSDTVMLSSLRTLSCSSEYGCSGSLMSLPPGTRPAGRG